ncbi:MAG: Zn-dependent hydrolase [Bacteroidales bacterium]|nr:Zn-dependent hydrolase [Bacteroidales bacterium]
MNKMISSLLFLVCGFACFAQNSQKNSIQARVAEYAYYDLKADMSGLTDDEKQLIPIFVKIADIMDQLFWKQTYGDPADAKKIKDTYARDFFMINYGPWDRLDDNQPFLKDVGPKPDMCNYYPQDITPEEYSTYDDPNKGSLYTVLRRDEEGKLKTVWYRDEYKDEITQVCALLDQAINIAKDPGMKNYLMERKKAFETDEYYDSDIAWMDMKNSNIDFVVGPIENYDDKLNEAKASYEAFILVRDQERSNELSKFIQMLPEIQKIIPCDPKYKTFVPGTSSDLNVYNVVYYAGDCNAGGKTIAINLPNDDRVQAVKGARRLQLRNSMQAKFDKIMLPISKVLIAPEQQQHVNFDAFFWNVTFHEVAHGLGVKETVNGRGSVDDALMTEKTSWEEAKADILGLFIVCHLIEQGEITNITMEDAVTTFIAGIFRSVRFGAADSHGTANMMCFNYLKKMGAFSRGEDGYYRVNYKNALPAIKSWCSKILMVQGEGNYKLAIKLKGELGFIGAELQRDLDRVNEAKIPRDIRFNQGLKVMGL